MSHYLHNVPGRLRVKSPVLKRNERAADELKKALSTMHGIGTVDINPLTGSLLVNYNHHEVKYPDIVSLLERKGYFDGSKAETNDQYIKGAARNFGSIIGRAVFGAFVERALQGSALSYLAILL